MKRTAAAAELSQPKTDEGSSGGAAGDDGGCGSSSTAFAGEPTRRQLLEQLLHSQLYRGSSGAPSTAADAPEAGVAQRLHESLATSVAELPPRAVISKSALAAFKAKHLAMMQAEQERKPPQTAAGAPAAPPPSTASQGSAAPTAPGQVRPPGVAPKQ